MKNLILKILIVMFLISLIIFIAFVFVAIWSDFNALYGKITLTSLFILAISGFLLNVITEEL